MPTIHNHSHITQASYEGCFARVILRHLHNDLKDVFLFWLILDYSRKKTQKRLLQHYEVIFIEKFAKGNKGMNISSITVSREKYLNRRLLLMQWDRMVALE